METVQKLFKSLRHSERSEESELKTRLFATLRVTIITFYTNSTPLEELELLEMPLIQSACSIKRALITTARFIHSAHSLIAVRRRCSFCYNTWYGD
jgi:hypothetical protein